MNKEDIEERIAEIKRLSWDSEAAHAREDQLYQGFVRMIADSNGPYSNMARLILSTQELKFNRWAA